MCSENKWESHRVPEISSAGGAISNFLIFLVNYCWTEFFWKNFFYGFEVFEVIEAFYACYEPESIYDTDKNQNNEQGDKHNWNWNEFVGYVRMRLP